MVVRNSANSEVTHIGFSDESKFNVGRYRSVAVISMHYHDQFIPRIRFQTILNSSGVHELRWANLRMARDRFAAIKIIDLLFRDYLDVLQIDVIRWDTHDYRHDISGRDDIVNLQRMLFHLLKSVLSNRWPSGSSWIIRPDEMSQLDWNIVKYHINRKRFSVRDDRNLFEVDCIPALIQRYDLRLIEPCSSIADPLVQLADLLAGMSAFSAENFGKFIYWRREQKGQQLSIFNDALVLTEGEKTKCEVLDYFDKKCKELKLQVGLESAMGLHSHGPRRPFNFWLYQSQGMYDKAPTKGSAYLPFRSQEA